MSKITKFAEGRACTARIPGVCNRDARTSVWAHLRSLRWGSGVGEKPPDVHGLIACSACHDVIDARVPRPPHLSRCEVMLMAYEGHHESLALLDAHGLIRWS